MQASKFNVIYFIITLLLLYLFNLCLAKLYTWFDENLYSRSILTSAPDATDALAVLTMSLAGVVLHCIALFLVIRTYRKNAGIKTTIAQDISTFFSNVNNLMRIGALIIILAICYSFFVFWSEPLVYNLNHFLGNNGYL